MVKLMGEAILKAGREESVQRFHPWIFSGALQSVSGSPEDGAWVAVKDRRGRVLGHGHFQQGSISVRVLSFGAAVPGERFWIDALSAAWGLRNALFFPSPETNAFRLVHGEADGLPGLIADYYDGDVVVQAHSHGMHRDSQAIADALKYVLRDQLRSVYYKSQSTLPDPQRGPDHYLHGSSPVEKVIVENGHRFLVNWEAGQKTGFFLDQRENRLLLQRYARGRTVLNTFCYTGGFSVYALHGGAKLVHSVDSSAKAMEMVGKNIELNQYRFDEHPGFAMDVFDFLNRPATDYDLIVLDPPAFAKHRSARHQAMKGYQRLNAEAIKLIKPGGIIFTFSCSQVIDKKLFYDTVVSSAIQAGRKVKVLHQLGQPADHPVSVFHPEGEYLKGLVLHVT